MEESKAPEETTNPEPATKERQFKFMKKDTPETDPYEVIVNESELTDDQIQATYLYLEMIFSKSPYKTQQKFIDAILEDLSEMAKDVESSEIVTPTKTIIGPDGQPMKSSHLKKLD